MINISIKILGILLVLAGLLLITKPFLISKAPPPSYPYLMIEARVKWGFLVGLGTFLLLQKDWMAAWSTLFAFLFFIILGIVIARVWGMFLDGTFPKQWIWLGIELVVLLIFALLSRNQLKNFF